jgi:hypothetical protein
MLLRDGLTFYDTMSLPDYQLLDLLLEQDGRSLDALAAWLPGEYKDPTRMVTLAVERLIVKELLILRPDGTVWLENRALAREVSERWHLRRGLWQLSQVGKKPRLRPSALAV